MYLDFALVLCVLLLACTSHPLLYTAHHNEYMSTAVSSICIYSYVMSLCTYYMRGVLVGPTIVVPNKYYYFMFLDPRYIT